MITIGYWLRTTNHQSIPQNPALGRWINEASKCDTLSIYASIQNENAEASGHALVASR